MTRPFGWQRVRGGKAPRKVEGWRAQARTGLREGSGTVAEPVLLPVTVPAAT